MTSHDQQTYKVLGMSCGHCASSVREEVAGVPGVGGVEVDLPTGRLVVRGQGVDDAAVRAAVNEAGYEVAP
jgi:copper chaperone CopZ